MLTTAGAATTRWQRLSFFLIVGALTAFAPLSIDMYLPALPAIARDFHTGPSQVQLTLTAFLAGIALGQLLAGPISDAVGRRRPLFVGVIGYVVASLLCAVAPSVFALAGLRLVQGLTGAAGVVIARAIVRDLHSGVAAARYFSLLMLITGLAPILAPSLGGQLLRATSWRGVFVVLAVIGALSGIAVATGLRETLPPERRRAGGLRDTGRAFAALFGDRVFAGYALSGSLAFAAIFTYISGSSFVLQGIYGISPQVFALLFGLNALGLVVATQINRRLAGAVPVARLLSTGLAAMAVAAVAMLVAVGAHAFGLAGVLVPLFVIMFSLGFVLPNGLALALSLHPEAAGTASALLGALQMGSGALAAPLVGIAGTGTALPMAAVMATLGLASVLALALLARPARLAATRSAAGHALGDNQVRVPANPTSLPRAVAARWAAAPDAPVLHCAERGWRSGAAMARDTAHVAAGLAELGLRRGERLVLCAGASSAFVDVYVAALRLGLVVVLLNPFCSEREALHVAADSEPAAAVVDDPVRGEWIARGAPSLRAVVRVDALPPAPALRPPPLDAAGGEDPAIIMYTSGTTGTAKGALLSHANLMASATSVVQAWHWTAADRLILALPLFHAHGLAVALNGTLVAGGSAVLQPRFDAAEVLDAVRGQQATMFFGVPTMYARLAAHPRAAELSRLRLCVSGSAPLSAQLFARVEEVCGQRVLERYGMTETLMLVSNPYLGERRPGTVGLPLPGVEMRLGGGARGEVLVRGPGVFSGYWRNPAATAEVLDGDGWMHTGDVGELDEAGYLRIVGRTRELIISGGYNVYPREVEDVLGTHPGVAEAAVVGTPSAEWGEVVTAFVVRTDAQLSAAALTEHARERLAPYKVPREVRFVEALPRNAMGKVVKQSLAAPAEGAPE